MTKFYLTQHKGRLKPCVSDGLPFIMMQTSIRIDIAVDIVLVKLVAVRILRHIGRMRPVFCHIVQITTRLGCGIADIDIGFALSFCIFLIVNQLYYNVTLNKLIPSLHTHYGYFITTTNQSAPIISIRTFSLEGSSPWDFPLTSYSRFPRST